jgi:hypothetical protein
MKNNTLFMLAITCAFLLIGAGCATPDESTVNNASSTTYGIDKQAILVSIEPGTEAIKTKTGTSTTATQSYTDALKIYGKNGYRFQFVNCSGIPGTINIKTGVKFMIDNRDGEKHQIGIGTQKFELPAYGFAVLSVQKAGNLSISCDGGGGAARLNVEK